MRNVGTTIMSPSEQQTGAPHSDTEGLRRLALKIEEKHLWAGYLSEAEHFLWRKALKSLDSWDEFLEGRAEPLEINERSDEREHGGGNDNSETEHGSESIVDPVTTAFRARVLLCEPVIRKLFPSSTGEDPFDFDLHELGVDVSEKAEERAEEKPKTRDIEEDNYDDDDEDEEQGKSEQALVQVNVNGDTLDHFDQLPPLPPIKSYPFDTYYHTFEHDRVAMLELQTAEDMKRQNSSEAGNGSLNSLQNVNFGAANLSLKYLLNKIDSKRDELNITGVELRKILSDVRRNRSNSKWASDELIGREELYEALESMLKKISAHKDAYPFLAKVRRVQAPDYHNIIKRPMDLGAMSRNLRTGTYYKSKAQFMEEMNLIWDNCLTYNSEPTHALRPLALSMRAISAQLADLVPDITVRTRAEVEAEEAAAEAEDDARSDDDQQHVKSSRKAGGFSSKGVGQKGGPSKMRGPTHEEPLENKLLNGVREGSIAGSQDGRSSSHVNGGYSTPPPGGTPVGDMIEPQLDPAQVAQQAQEEAGNDNDEGDVLSREWSSQTQQSRAKYALHRHKLFRKYLGEDELGYVRNKKGMSKFKEWEERAYDVVKFRDPEPEPDPEAEDVLNDDEDAEEDDFLAEYDVVAGTLPKLSEIDEETIKELYSKNVPSELSILDPRLRPPKDGLLAIMRENARKLCEIRKLCNKVAAIRNMGQQAPGIYQPSVTSVKQVEMDELAWAGDTEDDSATFPTSDEITPELASFGMEQSIAKILFHTGFEDFQPSAFDVMASVAIEYLQNIGHTLRTYLNNDDARKKYTEEEILLHALELNGVDSLERIDVYIKDDVERYGTKLEDCHRRLKRFLAELLRPALQEGEDGTNIFDEQNESFVSGDFTDELDEDFFGFRELGLDKELGLISLSVPLRLLQGRMRAAINPSADASQDSAQKEFAEPPPWEPITPESIEFEIGLLQPFYREKMTKSDQPYIVEDENLPVKLRPAKPRLPPTGKISTPRKRKDVPAPGGSASKKKKTAPKPSVSEVPPQLPTPPMASIREEDGSDIESLFG